PQILLDRLRHEEPPSLGRQREALRDDGIGRLPGDLLAVPQNAAAARVHQTRDRVERCRLARPVRAEQSDDGGASDLQRYVGNADEIAVSDLQMFDLQAI